MQLKKSTLREIILMFVALFTLASLASIDYTL